MSGRSMKRRSRGRRSRVTCCRILIALFFVAPSLSVLFLRFLTQVAFVGVESCRRRPPRSSPGSIAFVFYAEEFSSFPIPASDLNCAASAFPRVASQAKQVPERPPEVVVERDVDDRIQRRVGIA